MVVILAYDIERSGPRRSDDTIAIGAVIMDGTTAQLLGTFFAAGYIKSVTRFDERCWAEFWVHHPKALEQLVYTGPLSFHKRQQEMIVKFQAFRSRAEHLARVRRVELALVTDTQVFDTGCLNQMIERHTRDLPLPYRVSDQQYSTIWNVFSMQRAAVMLVDPLFKGCRGFARRLSELYNVPASPFQHNHVPDKDAAHIAYDFWVLRQIALGHIARRPVSSPALTHEPFVAPASSEPTCPKSGCAQT